MIGMRKLAVFAVAALLGFAPPLAAWAAGDTPPKAEIDSNGLYVQDWFLQSFLDLNEDMQEAAADGRNFAIIWEQRGCPYCRETHLVNFAQPEVLNFIRRNFAMLQLNIRGGREVTAFDGKTLSERALSDKYRVRYTPTVTFYGWKPGAGGDGKGEAVEITRMTGYYRPFHFLMAFQYVRDKAYLHQKFRPYIDMQTAARKKQGKPVNLR